MLVKAYPISTFIGMGFLIVINSFFASYLQLIYLIVDNQSATISFFNKKATYSKLPLRLYNYYYAT